MGAVASGGERENGGFGRSNGLALWLVVEDSLLDDSADQVRSVVVAELERASTENFRARGGALRVAPFAALLLVFLHERARERERVKRW